MPTQPLLFYFPIKGVNSFDTETIVLVALQAGFHIWPGVLQSSVGLLEAQSPLLNNLSSSNKLWTTFSFFWKRAFKHNIVKGVTVTQPELKVH